MSEEKALLGRLVDTSLITDDGIEGTFAINQDDLVNQGIPCDEPITVGGRLYEVGEAIHFSATATTILKLECGRCLIPFDKQLSLEVIAVYMREESFTEQGHGVGEFELSAEDMDIQLFSDDEIDLLPPIRDQILLSVPMSPLCSEECKGLCQSCGADLNESKCDCKVSDGDKQFAILDKLKLKK